MSMSIYVAELKNVIDRFGQKYSQIALVGHSLGAIISILFLSKYKKYGKNIDLILWDQSLLPWKKKDADKIFTFNPQRKLYRAKHAEFAINKTLYRELASVKSIDVFRSLDKRACIIAAENSGGKDAKKYFSASKNKANSRLYIIKNTSHLFNGRQAQKELFAKTINYIENISQNNYV